MLIALDGLPMREIIVGVPAACSCRCGIDLKVYLPTRNFQSELKSRHSSRNMRSSRLGFLKSSIGPK